MTCSMIIHNSVYFILYLYAYTSIIAILNIKIMILHVYVCITCMHIIIRTYIHTYMHLFPTEAIHQRILLYSKLVIAWAITKLLYSKVLTKLLSKVFKLTLCISSYLLDTINLKLCSAILKP